MEEVALKTCPFCGSDKIHEAFNYYECLECFTYGPSDNSPANRLRLTAKELWNLRSNG